tara:strand:- start:768 stop:938 length:171 start_codon:yes stop_codon:yes gene_type:complete
LVEKTGRFSKHHKKIYILSLFAFYMEKETVEKEEDVLTQIENSAEDIRKGRIHKVR